MKKRVFSQTDFSGGYATSLPADRMPDNMLLQAENVHWDDGLQKRGGVSEDTDFTSVDAAATAIRGMDRVYINDTWTTIVALDNGTNVSFYQNSSGSFVVINSPASFTWTTGKTVSMDHLGDKIVAANGSDKPAVIYYDSGFKIQNLETYDERTRNDTDFYAGQYDVSETNPYIGDTADAQDSDAADFKLATGGVNNDGFFISGVVTFNKITLKSVSSFDGSPVASYQYYATDGTWKSLTTTTTPTWTGAAGDKTIEFDIPLDADGELVWGRWDGSDADGEDNSMVNRFVIRIRFTTAPTSNQTCDEIELAHTQYLTQITTDDKAEIVGMHNNRMYLAAENTINYSGYNKVTDYEEFQVEYFQEGGSKILSLVSFREFMLVFKGAAIHGWFGNSFENFRVEVLSNFGTLSGQSVAFVQDNVYFVDTYGGVSVFTGESRKPVAKHIRSDLDTWTLTDTVGINYNGNYWLSFPSNSIVLRCDPDTYREQEDGDGQVSWYKYSGFRVDEFLWASGDSDSGKLYGSDNGNARLLELDNSNSFDFASTTIDCVVKSKRRGFGRSQTRKHHSRIKGEISQSGEWTLTCYADNEARSVTATIASGTSGTYYNFDVSLPYEMDGKDFSWKLKNDTVNDAQIYAVSADVALRSF